jgi:D-alanyl-D-alanine-carboxypeptidase/D-alanyl-D-alanine-endopeptidase
MKRRLLGLIVAASLAAAVSDDLHGILANRVDETKKAVGIVVGTIDQNGRHVTGYGKIAKDRNQVPDGDTVYEIGSITKVFSSLLLADMVERGEVKLDDPVSKYLPKTVKMPSRNGREITLLDISEQRSGLPRMPSNFKPADPANPYVDYGPAQLYAFLSGYTLTRDPGEKYEYSNLAVGLLGHVLSLRSGMSYEELVRKRVLEPLGMTSTSITLSADQKKRLASGYDAALKPVKNWDLDALAGAGAIRSTANDMLKFLAANLELTDTPLKPAMRRMRSVRKDAGSPNVDIGMGWHIFKQYGDIFWHNGGTAGYRSFAGFDPAKKTGVVVLCNTFFEIDDIGRHVLDNRYPVASLAPPKQRTAIAVKPEVLESYAGEYQFAPDFSIKVTRENDRLFAQATAQPRFEIFAEKETEFFFKVVDAQITFGRDDAGKVTHLILHQGGQDPKAMKVK